MKLALIALTVLTGAFANAETATYNLKGLHCGGCKSAIEGSVCKEMKDVVSCSVEDVDFKKQTGKLVITTKETAKIEDKTVTDLLAKAGEYKATRSTAAAAKK